MIGVRAGVGEAVGRVSTRVRRRAVTGHGQDEMRLEAERYHNGPQTQ